ncbi:hypothetical protein V494_07179 [Pseudogymnoascus sp. VKM F-4513 (FW-928)]|nr:hypothetical protein V494_07179 [Pseudogymnoascus sp. VKM F-4513 (FW-928)]
MPSSNSPRDDGASDGANSTENPFVKFRNVVDYHVGSVLQGIIGLPTILSRTPNSDNGRWAELEGNSQRTQGDLRRKNPQSGATENISDEGGNVPFRKFHRQSSSGNDAFGPSYNDDDDYDLFSAFNDSFIERVKRSAKGHPWLELQPGEGLHWRYEPSNLGVQESIQQRFHASLMDLRTDRGVAEPATFSEKSVVPYLLFSSYSPLNLMEMPALQPNDDLFGLDKDQFTYCDAFEDLLRESAGKPMRRLSDTFLGKMTGGILSIGLDRSRGRCISIFGNVTRLTPADIGMLWMGTSLVDQDILQEEPFPRQAYFDDPRLGEVFSMALSPIAGVLSNFVSHIYENGMSQSDADTEQDMYERFFARGSESDERTDFVGNTVHELLSMLESEGRAIRDVFNEADPTERNEASEKSLSSTTHTKSSRVSGSGSAIESTSSVPNSERVVSSSTSTTQHTDEDGTVRTKIVIEKRFADGRKSVTETSHTQSPSGEKQVQKNGYVEPADDEQGRDNKNGGNGNKKGWFWN